MKLKSKHILLFFLFIPFLAFSQNIRQAREFVKIGKIGEAIAEYSRLASSAGGNGGVLAEYACALALGGLHENALMYLDRANLLGGGTDFPFYAALSLSLMSQDTIAAEFWTPADAAPAWIAQNFRELLQKHKLPVKINYFDADSAYIRANSLAAQGMFFQSLILYRTVQIDVAGYSSEFLPSLSSSVVWENLSKYGMAARELEKSIGLMNAEQKETQDTVLKNALPAFENHLDTLKLKAADTQSLSSRIDRLQQTYKPQTMLYAGGMYASEMFSFNGRFGVFLASSLNAAFDLGLSGGSGSFYVNTGLTGYYRYKFLVGGTGFNWNIGTGGSLNWRLTGGLSFLNRSGNRSTDIFINADIPFSQGAKTVFSISIGHSFYFSKRSK